MRHSTLVGFLAFAFMPPANAAEPLRLAPSSSWYVNYADDINSSGKLLLALINDILDMSRIEAGQQKLMEEILSIDSVVNDCVRMVTSKASDGGVRLIVENKGPLPALRADERALKQILLNLLSNAV